MQEITPTETTTAAVVDLLTEDLHLLATGAIRGDERRFEDGEPGQRSCAIFHMESDADAHAEEWEMHPSGDEAVCCLSGDVRMYLRADHPERPAELVRLLPGQAAIVPRARWHRFEIDEPSSVLALTIRQGTQLESRRSG